MNSISQSYRIDKPFKLNQNILKCTREIRDCINSLTAGYFKCKIVDTPAKTFCNSIGDVCLCLLQLVSLTLPIYGIQSTGLGGSFVKSISGDYFNVMGFPLHRFCVEIRAMLVDIHMSDA